VKIRRTEIRTLPRNLDLESGPRDLSVKCQVIFRTWELLRTSFVSSLSLCLFLSLSLHRNIFSSCENWHLVALVIRENIPPLRHVIYRAHVIREPWGTVLHFPAALLNSVLRLSPEKSARSDERVCEERADASWILLIDIPGYGRAPNPFRIHASIRSLCTGEESLARFCDRFASRGTRGVNLFFFFRSFKQRREREIAARRILRRQWASQVFIIPGGSSSRDKS